MNCFMRIKFLRFFTAIVFCLFLAGAFSVFAPHAEAAPFSGGNGSTATPYIIATPEDLDLVRDYRTSRFILSNDIDLTDYLAPGGVGYGKWGTAGWEPIGTNFPDEFTGSFDGDGHVIIGLWIDRSSASNVGMFSMTRNAELKNLGVDISAAGIIGGAIVGGLVGYQYYGGSIVNCFTSGDVTGLNDTVGGLVGMQEAGSIDKCYATGNVTSYNYVGGLVGSQRNGSVENSYATGNVTATNSLGGGLVGNMQTNSSIVNSYAKGDVRVADIGGGLVGNQNVGCSIENCYATGNVIGNNNARTGGLVGLLSGGSIENCYATGNIIDGYAVGGLVGSSTGSIENCYASGNIINVQEAGGLVGMQSAGSIRNCYATGNVNGSSNAGGLVGYQQLGASIANSYRYQFAEVKLNGVQVSVTNNASGIHGDIVKSQDLMTKATYTGNDWLFNDSTPTVGPWYWDVLSFPKLNIGTEIFPFDFSVIPSIDITVQPLNATVIQGSISGALSVTASVTAGGALSYQWYSNTTNSYTGGAPISGATAASFTIPATLTGALSPYYYYCIVSAEDVASELSSIATVTVDVSVTGVTLNKSSLTLIGAGRTQQLTETIAPNNATDKSVSWISANPAVATVSPTGLVTAAGTGSTTITVTTNDGGFSASCSVLAYTSSPWDPSNDIIPEQPQLPPGTGGGIVSSEPIIIVPADSSDITLEKDMIETLLPGIDSTDLDVNKFGIITIDESAAKRIAKKLLSVDEVEVVTIPIFEASLNNNGETAAVSFRVKGYHLMVDELITTPDKVRLMNILSSDDGDWYTYRNTTSGLDDRMFTILDEYGNVFTGELDPDGDYILLFLIKDGGYFDLDKQTDGTVWGIVALVGVPVTGVELLPVTLTLSGGGSAYLSLGLNVIPQIADNQRVTWSVDDATIVSVDQNGIVIANDAGKAGIAVVTVTTVDGGHAASCTITVQPDAAIGVILNKYSTTLTSGAGETLIATVLPASSTSKDVIWSVSDAILVSVDQSGNVIANNVGNAGNAIVTVTTVYGVHAASCTVTVEPVLVTGVTLDKTSTTLASGVGDTLTATVQPANATNKDVTWSVSDARLASVNQSGNVTANNTGDAGNTIVTVTTTDGGHAANCAVTVEPVFVTGVTLNKSLTTLAPGAIERLTATIQPANATNKNVTWSVDDATIATVNQVGVVIANNTGKDGSAKITVTTADGGHMADCTVTVGFVHATGVTLDKTSITLASGASETLTATVQPTNATDRNVTWSVDDNTIATVNQSGTVTANGGAGRTIVTVTTVDGGHKTICVVEILPVPATGVTLDKYEMSLVAGTSDTLTATVEPPNATNTNVTWISSAPAIATVSGSGLVTGVSAGDAIITARTEDGYFMATCNVTVLPDVTQRVPPDIDDPDYPSDAGDVSNVTGIDPDNLEEIDGKVYLKKSLAEKIAKELLNVEDVDTNILPIFEGATQLSDDIVGLKFTLKGKDFLALSPEDVNLIGMTSGSAGEFLDYVNDLMDFDDGKFTILYNGTVFDDSFLPDEDYELVVFIKDAGAFDLDGILNGKVIASIFLASEKAAGRRGGSGCNADNGMLALALLGVVPLAFRKK